MFKFTNQGIDDFAKLPKTKTHLKLHADSVK